MDIAALLSGGVDSSVVVHLLCEQGYKPTLFYIKIGMDGAEYMDCSAEEDIELSTATARKYGLSLEASIILIPDSLPVCCDNRQMLLCLRPILICTDHNR